MDAPADWAPARFAVGVLTGNERFGVEGRSSFVPAVAGTTASINAADFAAFAAAALADAALAADAAAAVAGLAPMGVVVVAVVFDDDFAD